MTAPTSTQMNELIAGTYSDTLNEVLADADTDYEGYPAVLDFINEVVKRIRNGELSWQKGVGND